MPTSDFDTSLVWFRRDLRSFDHAALHHALARSRRVVCVFVFDREILDPLPRSDRRVAFIHASVLELAQSLNNLGGTLLVRYAQAQEEIPRLAAQLGADAVFANHDYEPAACRRDAAVAAALAAAGRKWFSFKDQVIFERDEILTQSGTPFSVFTPYRNAWLKRLHADEEGALAPMMVEDAAARLYRPDACDEDEIPSLQELGFAPVELPLAAGMSGAQQLFDDFAARMHAYTARRDFPAQRGPSYLSVHLRFGTVSVRGLVRQALLAMRSGAGEGAATWLSELIWRDFYFMILHHHPHVVERAFKPVWDALQWEGGALAEERFAAWCEGRTGYPLVDAAMLQLNRTGYMHNRLRMLTASFLVKDLGVDWRRGERYFALQLNDYDLAANNGGWQWSASTGCDAQPYFRIFNPVAQSKKFDPDGAFIRRYLPQLARLPAKHIHAPWKAPAQVLQDAGVRLEVDYPLPIVDHATARARTLERFAAVREAVQDE